MSPLRFEAILTAAAVRRAARRPSGRTVWLVVGAAAAAAFVVNLATAGSASRDFGMWAPPPALVAGVVLGLLVLAAAVGARTPPAYGLRGADGVWWRYAGIGRHAGERATTAIAAVRAGLLLAAGALPLGVALAAVASRNAPAILGLAALTVAMGPACVLAGAWAAERAAQSAPAGEAARAGPRLAEAGAVERPRARGTAPLGTFGLVTRLRRRPAVPWVWLAGGALAGALAPRLAAAAGGQAASLAAVMGPLAVVLGDALRGSRAVDEMRSPWWRLGAGTGPRAAAEWAFADTLPAVAALTAGSLAFIMVGGLPLVAGLAVPELAYAPVVLRLASVAVDANFSSSVDRRGPVAAVRAFAALAVLALVALAAFAAAEAFGIRFGDRLPIGAESTMFAFASFVLGAASFTAARWASRGFHRTV